MVAGLEGKTLQDKVSKLLAEADWESIGKQLAAHAVFRTRILAWRTGDEDELASGLQAVDLAQQAITKLLHGDRSWDPERVSLLDFLKGVVDSDANHLVESRDNELQVRFPEGEEGEELADRAEFNALQNDPAGLSPVPLETPCDAASRRREGFADERLTSLFEAAEGKRDLQDVLDTIMALGEWKPAGIAGHLKIPVSEANNRLKRLRRLADREDAPARSMTHAAGK